MESSGKRTSSAPSSRARAIQSAIRAAFSATAPTVEFTWASARRRLVGVLIQGKYRDLRFTRKDSTLETVGTLRRLSAPMAWLLALAALLAPPAASAQDAGEPAQPIFTPAEASAQLDQAVEALSATARRPRIRPTSSVT